MLMHRCRLPAVCPPWSQAPTCIDIYRLLPLAAPLHSQSIEQIKMIIEESRKAHGAMLGAGIETDEYIDDAMGAYEDEDYR
eukprot:352988-Chlamydomonas_euryale.AAC.3